MNRATIYNFNEGKIHFSWKRHIDTDSGRKVLDDIRNNQIHLFLSLLKVVENPSIGCRNNYLLEQAYSFIYNCLNTEIHINSKTFDFNDEYINRGVIVLSNHHGIGKLAKITTSDLKNIGNPNIHKILNEPLINDEPFMIRSAPILHTLCNTINTNIKPYSIETTMPYPFNIFQAMASVIGVPPLNSGKYKLLEKKLDKKLQDLLTNKLIPAFVIYPEGSTSGKNTTEANPYRLKPFKTGAFVYACKRKIPILPIVQVADKYAKVTVKVLDLVPPEHIHNRGAKKSALTLHDKMQNEINYIITQSTTPNNAFNADPRARAFS